MNFNDRRLRLWGAGVLTVVLLTTTYFCLEKSVTIKADDKVIKQTTFKKTVGEVLEANNIEINPHDQVTPEVDSEIREETEIIVTRAFPVTVVADGQSRQVTSVPVKVRSLLEQAKVTIGEKDLVSAGLDDLTHPKQVINVTRVAESTINTTSSIPFSRQIINDDRLEMGLTRTASRGRPGIARQLVKVTYHDGKEVKREVISSELTRQPVPEVIARGTITSVSRGGLRLDFDHAIMAVATAYTYTGRNTATGKSPAVGLVAVDPAAIPMGSRLYIEGYGYAVAADRGGSIKGNKVDVFMESKSECLSWGRRAVKIYVLRQ